MDHSLHTGERAEELDPNTEDAEAQVMRGPQNLGDWSDSGHCAGPGARYYTHLRSRVLQDFLPPKSVKTAAGQHHASRRPQTTQDGNHIALRCGTEIEGTRRPLKVEATSADKTTRDKRVPEGHSLRPLAAVYCSSPPGREDSSVFLTDTKLIIAFLQFLHFSELNTHTHTHFAFRYNRRFDVLRYSRRFDVHTHTKSMFLFFSTHCRLTTPSA
jgi:hypothetical protein